MKIRIISFRDIAIDLRIEKKYVYRNPIIPIGCDCHPACVLAVLNLRKKSFPFDWMNTTPYRGIDYVNKNIHDGFESFLLDLTKNEKGYVVSRHYLDAEFFHFPDLIDSQERRETLLRRVDRFLDFFNNRKCFFLFNVTSDSLKNSSDASSFIDSVNQFHKITKGKHILLIYIRYDESFQENEMHCNLVEQEIRKLDNTRIAKFIRYNSTNHIWGDGKRYTKLFDKLGVKLRLGFPKILFEWTKKETW